MKIFVACLLVCAALTNSAVATAQNGAATPGAEVERALAGSWVGTLEYRDYSEPADSTKRVKLPTWLTVEAANGGLRFRYIYDDGPAKVVTEEEMIRIDATAATYVSLKPDGTVEDSYSIAGLGDLHEGRGVLVLTGKGTENKAPVDVRTTLRIGRNILEMTRETAAAGQAFSFRHTYTFVRAVSPQPLAAK